MVKTYSSAFSNINCGDGVNRSGELYAAKETYRNQTRFTIDITTNTAESIEPTAIKYMLSTIGYKWRREFNLTALLIEAMTGNSELYNLYIALKSVAPPYVEIAEHSWFWAPNSSSTTGVTGMLNGNGGMYAVPAYARTSDDSVAYWVWTEAIELDTENTQSQGIKGFHIKMHIYK